MQISCVYAMPVWLCYIYRPMVMNEQTLKLTLAHSPDSDDAFMFWALRNGYVGAEGLEFDHVISDIQSLNQAVMANRYDITALSLHAWPYVSQVYSIMDVGASVGDGYGPIVVSKKPMSFHELSNHTIGIPGSLTTAALVLRLAVPESRTQEIAFDEVMGAVKNGEVEAGVIIHEGQITYKEEGLHFVVDLGKWWQDQTGLPLPLGINAIRKELGDGVISKVVDVIRESIRYAFDHREEGLNYAAGYGRNLTMGKVDKFVSMYVNNFTVELGEKGQHAVRELLKRGGEAGIVPMVDRVEFAG